MKIPKRLAAITAAVGLLALAACSPEGTSSEPAGAMAGAEAGAGVPAGSGKEAYVAALADMQPITLNFGGLSGGPQSPTVAAYVKYGELVTEWSGGKITFDYDFGGAKLTLDKMADGLGQGRMDMGLFIPAYQPDKWPVTNLIAGLGGIGKGDPVAGKLAMLAAKLEFGHTWDALQKETNQHGVQAAIPLWQNHEVRMHCTSATPLQSLADLKGKRMRISDSAQSRVAKALGMVPVSMVNAELYQGLQRGVVDCAVNGIAPADQQGYYDVVKSWTLESDELVWNQSPTAWGYSAKQWSQLPLAARQLLWDTLPTMIELQIESAYGQLHQSLTAAKEKGIAIGAYDDEVLQVVRNQVATEKTTIAEEIKKLGLAEDGAKVVADYEATFNKWFDIASKELNYPADVAWDKFAETFDVSSFDAKPLVDRLYQEVLLPRRPS